MMIKGELEKKMKKMIIISSVIVVLLLTMSIFLRIYLNHIVRNNMIDQVDNTVDKVENNGKIRNYPKSIRKFDRKSGVYREYVDNSVENVENI